MAESKLRVGDTIPNLYPRIYTKSEIAEDKRLQAKIKAKQRLMPWEHKPVQAVVAYIHPECRFATIRFDFERGSFCEAFAMRRPSNG